MDGFRYPQYCALARASELLAERWTLPLVRELSVGPQRFGDLLRRLPGLSSSVLSTRLARLEGAGVVVRKELPPPASCQVYALGEAGRALAPALRALMVWGLRFLGAPREGDHFEPDWLLFAFRTFARRGPVPARRFEVRVPTPGDPLRIRIAGGPDGAHVVEDTDPVDLAFTAPPLVVLGLATGRLEGEPWLRSSGAAFEGDASALRDFPALFDVTPEPE